MSFRRINSDSPIPAPFFPHLHQTDIPYNLAMIS